MTPLQTIHNLRIYLQWRRIPNMELTLTAKEVTDSIESAIRLLQRMEGIRNKAQQCSIEQVYDKAINDCISTIQTLLNDRTSQEDRQPQGIHEELLPPASGAHQRETTQEDG